MQEWMAFHLEKEERYSKEEVVGEEEANLLILD